MDDDRFADAMTAAALDRELEAALAVDPSPEFVTGVRMRVARERDAASSPWRWQIAAAVACVAILALVVAMSRQGRARTARDESLVRPQPAVAAGAHDIPLGALGTVAPDNTAAQVFAPAPATAFRTSASRRRPSAALREPKLLMAADETRALRQLFSKVRKGRIDLSSLQGVGAGSAPLQPAEEIEFPPITFEPIALQTAEEGEGQ